ncbi:hypothetical protein TcYC6_0082470 [Trypanosoma cruzi]|nr:hypothetical protein TcYC6_0082470 [Trypanosoma cruzi]
MDEKSRAAFWLAVLDVAPSARPQHARMPRPMSQMNRSTLAMAFLGLQKIAARPETRGRAPSRKEGVDRYPLPSRWQATGCFSTRVDAGEPFVRDCGLDSQNFTLERTGPWFWIGPRRRRRRGRIPTAPRGPPGYESRTRPTP